MKKPGFVLILFLILISCKKNADQQQISKKLQALLEAKEYFKLADQLKAYSDVLAPSKKLFYNSFADNAFNRNQDCVGDIDTLLKSYPKELADTDKIRLLRLQGDSYFKLYQYARSAASCDSILKHYSRVVKPDELADVKNDSTMRSALKDAPQQQTFIKENTTLHWQHDKLGLIEIPAKTNHIDFTPIFDTRANISSITQTYARKLGVHMLNVSYNEGSGATGIQFKTSLGIADSLYLGNILVKNVVFQVMPDSILYIAPVKFQLNVILGFPVIEQLKEVHIFKDGRMTIPARPQNKDLHNFALDGLDPVIALKKGDDTLLFHFDSGASSSQLYKAYYDKYKNEVEKTGVKKVMGFGGAGGVQKKQVYVLPHLSLTLGNKKATIDSASVLTKKIIPDEYFYGNIGQDFTNNFSELIYNFKYMYVEGR
jgi:hypothetical protein